MKTLLKNGKVVNVFTKEIEKKNVLLDDNIIIGVDDYKDDEAEEIFDLKGKYVCPGFIDGHIHIESTMLLPYEFSKVSLVHGTTSIVCDPHEIANVCGKDGIDFMFQASEGLPFDVYFMIPSCVPATQFDESGATLLAKDISKYFKNKRVLGLAEMMNYIGVVNQDQVVCDKLKETKKFNKIINGHAPMLEGKNLDKYIASGIKDDHECSSLKEAIEKLRKGQRIMIRQGSAAKNLDALLPLFDEPYCDRCLLVSDDKHPYDLIVNGHIDDIIREAVKKGKNVINAIRMATLGACEAFDIKDKGAIAPGYKADMLILDNLEKVNINTVIKDGKFIYKLGKLKNYKSPKISNSILKKVCKTFNISQLKPEDFKIEPTDKKIRIIEILKGELITNEIDEKLNFELNNGINIKKDIIKLAVCERHKKTGHKTVGFIKGLGLKKGAIASSISHDSHNLIIIGTNEGDMALAGNTVIKMNGGCAVVKDGKIISKMQLEVAGLMTDLTAKEVSEQNLKLRKSVSSLGVNKEIEPFMNMAFVSLSVIPNLKMTTKGLIDVNAQKIVPLMIEE